MTTDEPPAEPPPDSPGHAEGFAVTRWTLVNDAKADSDAGRQALSDLCEAYWSPVFRFLASEGRSEDEARELAQEFFRRLLAGSGVRGADSDRGRFRSYLLGALKHFLADERRRAGRLKRGGEAEVVALAAPAGDRGAELEVEDPASSPDPAVFDREWAFTVLARALANVRDELAAHGEVSTFEVLKPWLTGASAGVPQQVAAEALGLSTGAVKVSIHRLRRRFRRRVQEEIAQTMDDGGDVAGELRYLLEVVSRAGGPDPEDSR